MAAIAVPVTACSTAATESPEDEVPGGGTTTPGAGEVGEQDPVVDASPARDASGSDGTKDAGKDASKDAGADRTTPGMSDATTEASTPIDANVSDARPDATWADPGTACAPASSTESRQCGICGGQSRICQGAAGSSVWLDWGACIGEKAGGCIPGTTRNSPCGLCGTKSDVCQSDCTWASGFCNQPPQAECNPGDKKFAPGLSCDAGGRTGTCQADCSWSYGACEVPTVPDGGGPLGAVTIAASTVAGANKVTVLRNLDTGHTAASLDWLGTCPISVGDLSTVTPYDQIVLFNPDASRTARVSVWTHSAAGGGTSVDTIMAAYNRATPPANDTERAACNVGVTDSCVDNAPADATACKSSWAGIIYKSADADTWVVVPPRQSIVVEVGGYDDTDSGPYSLSVRTDYLQ